MPAIRVTDFLIHRGWTPLDHEFTLWVRPGEEEPVTFFWAAHKEGIPVPHCWNKQLACEHCGITQYRVMVLEESQVCYGVPDSKAFADAANFDKLTDRIERALNGEEGIVWDSKND